MHGGWIVNIRVDAKLLELSCKFVSIVPLNFEGVLVVRVACQRMNFGDDHPFEVFIQEGRI